jgi:hypothetical protein
MALSNSSIISRSNRTKNNERKKKDAILIVRGRMFSCSLLTLIASSLFSHTSIRSLAVHRSLIMLRVFSLSFCFSYLVVAASIYVFDYIMRLITLNMYAYPTHPPLFISVSQPHDACLVLNVRYIT